MFPFVFLLSTVVLAVTGAPTTLGCPNGSLNYTITALWSLPLTPLAPGTCVMNFHIPPGYFAIADVLVNNLHGETGPPEVWIYDKYTFNFDSEGEVDLNGTFHGNAAWPSDFSIQLNIHDSKATMQISITLQKDNHNNVVKSIKTGTNKPSAVVYLESWQEGTSVSVTGDDGQINLYAVIGAGEVDDFQNIFVYDGGNLMGTMHNAIVNEHFHSTTGNVILYKAKKTAIQGVVLGVDATNVDHMDLFFSLYVPIYAPDHTDMVSISAPWAPSAITVIGNEDGSTPIDLRNILCDGKGDLSYSPSGPLQDHSGATIVTKKQLPVHCPSNINTFYYSSGHCTIKYTISN